jgi:hypothetical protein
MSDDVDLDVVLEDLLTDANKWDDVGGVVGEAHSIATGVELCPDMVTDGLSYAQGFQGQYNELAGEATSFLNGGVSAISGIASRLRDTHDAYELAESDATNESVAADWA